MQGNHFLSGFRDINKWGANKLAIMVVNYNNVTLLKDNEPVLYHEVQYFRSLWLWFIIIFSAIILFYAVYRQISLREPFGNNPAPDIVLIVLAVIIGIGFPLLFSLLNLSVNIRLNGLYYRFFPFQLSYRKISWYNTNRYQICRYSPIKKYGKGCIKYGKVRRAYTVSGDQGVEFKLKSGKIILIGTQNPEEFAAAVKMASGMVQFTGN